MTEKDGSKERSPAPTARPSRQVVPGARSVSIGGSADGSTIITGDHNVVGQQQGATLAEFMGLLAELRRGLSEANLDQETAEVIEADVRRVEAQAAAPQPKGFLILPKLKSVAETLATLAGAAASAQKLLPMAQQAVEWAGQLFR